MLAQDGPDTLHYCDPPYLPETRDKGGDYRHEMSETDHAALLIFLRGLRGHVILSGYPSALYDEMLPGWERIDRPALADGARARTECLWLSPSTRAQGRLALYP